MLIKLCTISPASTNSNLFIYIIGKNFCGYFIRVVVKQKHSVKGDVYADSL